MLTNSVAWRQQQPHMAGCHHWLALSKSCGPDQQSFFVQCRQTQFHAGRPVSRLTHQAPECLHAYTLCRLRTHGAEHAPAARRAMRHSVVFPASRFSTAHDPAKQCLSKFLVAELAAHGCCRGVGCLSLSLCGTGLQQHDPFDSACFSTCPHCTAYVCLASWQFCNCKLPVAGEHGVAVLAQQPAAHAHGLQ